MAEATPSGSGLTGHTPGGDGQAGSTTEQAQEKAREVAGQAQEKAGQAADQARAKVREQVDQRSTEVGQKVTSNASDMRSVADELRKQGKDGPARVAEQAADRVERAGSWLTESDGDRILRDVEDFGRKNPWAVAAGGLAIGFLASRLLKASSSERYRSTTGNVSTRGSLGTHATSGAMRREAERPTIPEPSTQLPAGAGVGPANGAGGL
jgi:ElaB/YqjD/DUF883 family membrane-anchored ribosome-binding protein